MKILGYSLAISLTCTPLAWAFNGIATDGSMGPAQVLSAPGVATNVNIPQNLGTTVGNNLFHSFSTFNIETGQTVMFQENAQNTLDNIISRVTGGGISNLDGTLRSTPGGHADFFFINPAGIVFGTNAQLDMAGTVHFSTADQLNFQDGGHYNATNPNASSLSSSAPASFGFLGTSNANNGLIEFDGTQIKTQNWQTLDVVAGQIKVENSAEFYIPLGEVRMVAMQGQGQVDLQPTTYGNLPLPNSSLLNAHGGDITIKDSTLSKPSYGWGRIALWGGNISIVNSGLTADSLADWDELPEQGINIQSSSLAINNFIVETVGYGSGKAGDLALSSTGNMDIINGSVVHTMTSGLGAAAGDLTLQAGQLNIGTQGTADANYIESFPDKGATGKPGKINIETQSVLNLYGGSDISTTGPGGDITIKVGGLKLDSLDNPDNLTQISTIMPVGGVGTGGSINVESRGAIEVFHNASIFSETDGVGNAGNINIKSQSLKLDGLQCTVCPSIESFANIGSSGNAGSVTIETLGAVELYNGSLISNTTQGSGNGGILSIKADSLKVVGSGNNQLSTEITTTAQYGTGKAGDLLIETRGALEILNTAEISSGGFAGNVSVKAGYIKIDGQGSGYRPGIFSSPISNLGHSGSVTVESTGNIELTDQGSIQSGTLGASNAGDVTVKAYNIIMDGQGSPIGTYIASDTYKEAQGNAGSVNVQATDSIYMKNGAYISSSSFGKGDSGNVSVQSNILNIDGLGNNNFVTGIFSQSNQGSTGRAGTVSVKTAGNLGIYNDGIISSSTWGSGNAGGIDVKSSNIDIDGRGSPYDTGILSVAGGGTGNAGSINIESTGSVNLQGGGFISTSSFSQGSAGNISVKASAMNIDGHGGYNAFSAISSNSQNPDSGKAGSITVDVQANLDITYGGQIATTTGSQNPAGEVSVKAGNVIIDGQGKLTGISSENSNGGTGNGGSVSVESAQTLEILNGGLITSSSYSSGNAGKVFVSAGDISLDGNNNSLLTGIFSTTKNGTTGKDASVSVQTSGSLDIFNGSNISTSTFGTDDAGQISVNAKSMTIDPQQSIVRTGISSVAEQGSQGQGGTIGVTVSGPIDIQGPGTITSNTFGPGNAGSVTVKTDTLKINGRGTSFFSGIASDAKQGSTGQAGSVDVSANSLVSLSNAGRISTNTSGLGAAGSVTVTAQQIDINNASIAAKADANSGGQTGDVAVNASGSINIAHGGNISIESQGTAANPASVIPGQLTVTAPVIALDNGFITASTGGNVNAGTVAVDASQTLSETNVSFINALTSGPGNAGRVKVDAPVISLDNSVISAETSGLGAAGSVNVSSTTLSLINNASIAAKADANSGGQTGNVAVNASRSITMDNSNISIQNLGFALDPKAITPGLLYVSAPDITLRGSSITSQSTQNVGASPIQIQFTHSLSLDPSFISTEAQNGNGGSITIQGGDILTLANSGIRTSVLGQNGNGGNISVTVNRLVMETGLIQANTAAKGANGGTVFLNVETLLPSGSMLIFGGNEPVNWDIHSNEFGWNVIQAAAPGGISGVINLTSPQLNLNGVLSNFGNPKFYSETLNQDICSMGTGSSLVRRGKGGMPVKSSDSLLFY